MSLTPFEQRRALLQQLDAIDLQRAAAFKAIIDSPAWAEVSAGLTALHDPTETAPPNGAMTVNVGIGWVVQVMANAPGHAQSLLDILTTPEPVEGDEGGDAGQSD